MQPLPVSSKIYRRKLNPEEISALVHDTEQFPNLVYVHPTRWQGFARPYIIEDDSGFAGACQVYEFANWIKVGPFVILQKSQGKGLSKHLIRQIMADHQNKNILVVSSNPALQHVLRSAGFIEKTNYLQLPAPVKLFLIGQLVEYFNLRLVTEFFRKLFVFRRGPIHFYLLVRQKLNQSR